MKSCRNCRDRAACRSLCPEVERRLPGELSGKDGHREVNLGPRSFNAAVEEYSYALWQDKETARRNTRLNFSKLAPGEKAALRLLVSGLSERAAAARLEITRATLRSRVRRAIRKIRAAHFAHFIGGCDTNTKRGGDDKGGGE